jgi:hypothetical protein
MKLHNYRRLWIFILSIVFIATFAGCGGGAPSSSTATPTQSSPATQAPLPTESTPATQTVTPNPTPVQLSLTDIDRELAKSSPGNIAYNAPTAMTVDEIITFQLLVSPTMEGTALAATIAATNENKPNVEIASAKILITPKMIAEVKSADPDAFDIVPLQDSEQLISNLEPTEWKWTVRPKKEGDQILTLTVFRIVQVGDQEFTRPIASYVRNIKVKVTLNALFGRIDWKGWLGLVLSPILIPIVMWLVRRSQPNDRSTRSRKQHKQG